MRSKGLVRDRYPCASKVNDIHSITCQLRWVWHVDVSSMCCTCMVTLWKGQAESGKYLGIAHQCVIAVLGVVFFDRCLCSRKEDERKRVQCEGMGQVRG